MEISISDLDRQRSIDNDFVQIFRKKLSETEQECVKKNIPYCTACAWNDFTLEMNNLRNLAKMKMGIGGMGQLNEDVLGNIKEFKELPLKFDYDKYSKGWKILGESEIREPRVSPDGNRYTVIAGIYLNCVCNKYGHGYSMQVEASKADEIRKAILGTK